MINILIPNNNIEERKYAISECFNLLGLECSITIGELPYYQIKWNNFIINIYDYFFSKFPKTRSYLDKCNIPNSIIYGKNQFTVENDIPIIFGNDNIIIQGNTIDCHIDIFASIFFMLSRWEEYVITERDVYGRFLSTSSLAFKCNFLHRPIVNEYSEMLWNMMFFLDENLYRNDKKFNLVLTHDIDLFRKGIFKFKYFKEAVISCIIRRDIQQLIGYFEGVYNYSKDPYNTFDYIMSKSEQIGVKSHFYFMSDNNCEYIYTKDFAEIIEKIKNRGHIIGFHPGYNTCSSNINWTEEKKKVEKYSNIKLKEGRQHILQVDLPTTFNIWESNGMEIDSTLGFADNVGFRCGTGDIFTLFNVTESRPFNLKEMPLVIMECSLSKYQNKSMNESQDIINYYFSISNKYHSTLTLLFHNTSLCLLKGIGGWGDLYSNLTKYGIS